MFAQRSLSDCATGSKGRATMKSSRNQRIAHTPMSPRKTSLWIIALIGALALVALGVVLQSSPAEGNEGPVVTYTHGRVNVAIPFHAGKAGSGRLRLEILDPEDHVVAQTTRDVQVNEGSGRW